MNTETLIAGTALLSVVNFAISAIVLHILYTNDARQVKAHEKRQAILTTRLQAANECKIPAALQNDKNIGPAEETELPDGIIE